MSAMMALGRLSSDDDQVTKEEVMEALAGAGVIEGISYQAIDAALAAPDHNTPVKIASGIPMQRGQDTNFEILFKTSQEHKPNEDEHGLIDYRDLDFVLNAKEGDVLARKIPPTIGVNGKGVDGSEIVAPRGREKQFKKGDNTTVSEDGTELIASADGALVYNRGLISVKDVLVITGNVDFNVGNIDAVGSVRVTGDVQSGFSIKAGGNLEVIGNVEDAAIDCAGNVLIKGGCFGEGGKSVKAAGDIVVKYAEGQNIISGNDVIVGGELLNCHVIAKEKIHVKGRRGKIIGGEISAGKEIRAALLGSEAGTITKLAVAFDAELMKKYHEVVKETERIRADGDRVKEALVGLYRQEMDGKLTPEQKVVIEKLEQFNKNSPQILEDLKDQKIDLEERMKQFQDAQIIAEDTIYSGVQAHFGIIYRDITEAMQKCRLTLDGSQVLMSEFKDDAK
jgi:uncharacterized protein (DUF342 family)